MEETSPGFLVEQGLLIYNPHLMQSAKVLRSFSLKVRTVQNEFVATSNISDIYELGTTDRQVVLNYLYSLIDEVVWFQERKESLSKIMLEKLNRLKLYLCLEG